MDIPNQGTPTELRVIKNIVDTLFPTHPKRVASTTTDDPHDIPLFTERKLTSIASAMRSRKAPGPDGLTAELMKAIAKSYPKVLLVM